MKTIITQIEERYKELEVGIPVGGIEKIPKEYWDGKLTENWRICNGDKVNDEESPVYGMNILDYEDENFIYLIKIK